MVTIGILGGTGPAGSGLGLWLARGGNNVVLGSRQSARAAEVVETLVASEPEVTSNLRGGDNAQAAMADVVIIAAPWSSLLDVLRPVADDLTDKIVVSMVNPMHRTGGEFVVASTPSGSAALSVAHWLPRSRVIAAFHHVPAAFYQQPRDGASVDVLAAASSRDDFDVLASLTSFSSSIKLWHAGDLAASATLEQLTPMLLNLNARYGTLNSLRLVDQSHQVIDLATALSIGAADPT